MTKKRTTVSSNNICDADAYKFDQVLKKLETTKQQKQQRQKQLFHRSRHHPLSSTVTESRHHSDSSDNSSRATESSNGSTFGYDSGVGGGGEERNDDECSSGNSESQIFETRQSFVDRQVGGSIPQDLVNSFIERVQSVEQGGVSDGGEAESYGESEGGTHFVEESLPDAILKVWHLLHYSRTIHSN